jgi:cell division transport system permease protein
MRKLPFFIVEAFRALRRNAAPSLAAVVTILVTTVLLGVLIPVLKASSQTTSSVRSQLALRVFLYDDATKAQLGVTGKKIRNLPHVDRAKYVSKADAKKTLRKEVGKGPLREGLDQLKSNPLPASFNVYPDNPDNLAQIRRSIDPGAANGKSKPLTPAIQGVNDSRQAANKIRSVTGAVKIVLIVIAALLLIASVMLVGNTIRLSIYARRREVEVMRLVGATNWFIRWPFVIEGLIVGLSGAALAVGVLYLGKVTIVDPLASDFTLINNFSTVGFVPLVAALVAASMAISAVGSGVTLRRFLRI